MENIIFNYAQPVKIVFGGGSRNNVRHIAAECGFTKGLLICDAVFTKNGIAEKLADAVPSVAGIFDGFTANPSLDEADEAARRIADSGADYVIALGGGSAIDLSKFACAIALCGGSAEDYFYGRKAFPKKGVPLIVMPTTAGTGSEVTSVSVITDRLNNVKKPIANAAFYPQIAVVDYELTTGVPPFVTAATGLDALAHAIEAYWCKAHNPVSDALAAGAIKSVLGALEAAWRNGEDKEAREKMSLGALLAGLAFAPTRTAAVHACSYPLSEIYGMSHGEACAYTLDRFIRLNAKGDGGRTDGLARIVGYDGADAMADEVARLKSVTGMRATLEDIGCSDTAALAEACAKQPLMGNNPVAFGVAELKEMFDGTRK